MNSIPLEELTLARFSELVGTAFRVQPGPDAVVGLELAEVTPGSMVAPGGANVPQYESFSLLLRGSAGRPLRQGTYRFEGDRTGSFELFIVPIGIEHGMMKYQAVFNRLIAACPTPSQKPTA